MNETDEHAAALGRPPRDDRFLFGDPATPQHAPDVFQGLRPRHLSTETESTGFMGQWSNKTMRGGLPLLMTGSLAAGVGVTQAMPVQAAPASHPVSGENQVHRMKTSLSDLIAQAFVPLSQRVVNSVAPHVPDTYQVRRGDTITSVAEKFGMPTAVLLSLNGLSWNSILHEGQIVRLTMAPSKQRGMAPPRISEDGYRVEPGDSLATIAERLGMSEYALAIANQLEPGTFVEPGTVLRLPDGSSDVAPRTVPIDSGNSTPRIVLASSTQSPQSEQSQQPDTEDARSDDTAEPETPAAVDNPLSADILEAPQLRPDRTVAAPTPPPAPTPTPVATPAPPVQEAQDEDDDDEEKTEAGASESSVGQPKSGAVTPLNDTRRANAQVIVDVGRDLGVPDYGIVIALATAMQESSLRNIDWGDRDSVGLFQQRPSTGWGSAEQIMDPVFAARAFYGGPSNPNAGRTRGLLDYSGWQSMELTVAAQKVQRSAYPSAYAKWEASAWAWLDELG